MAFFEISQSKPILASPKMPNAESMMFSYEIDWDGSMKARDREKDGCIPPNRENDRNLGLTLQNSFSSELRDKLS